LPTLKLPNQRCQAQPFEIANFLFGRALTNRGRYSGALFIARCDAAELFQAVDQALDPIAKPVGSMIEVGLAALVALAGNDGPDAALSQTAPGRWAAVAFVARHAARPQAGPAPPGAGDRTPVQDVRQSDLLVALAAGQNGRDRPTMAFGAQVDLG